MRQRLLDLIRCPVCGGGPFLLTVLRDEHHPIPSDHPLRESDPDGDREIVEAVLRCPDCARWYAVREGIPDLVRDGLRDTQEELGLLERHRDHLPADLLEEGPPFNLRHREVTRTADEIRMIEEGRYWGEFMLAYWDIGDLSIFDSRALGTHPPFYGQGVVETDNRDRYRRLGIWPDHLEYLLFSSWMDDWRGARALDVGCGGGQYGLEAARRGLDVIGIDPSRRAMELARLHARNTGAEIQFVRADPAHPPFRRLAFDVLMAKASLHHIPDVGAVLDRLDTLLVPGGLVAAYEHIGHSPRRKRVMDWLIPRLIPPIQRRYGMTTVPPVLLHESPNEDAAMSDVEPQLHRLFTPLYSIREIFLYFDAEQLVYFATGKRRFPAWLARVAFRILDNLLLADGEEPEHLVFVGKKPRGRVLSVR